MPHRPIGLALMQIAVVLSLAAQLRAATDAPTTQATSVSRKDFPEDDELASGFFRTDLPKDIPTPASTPYDTRPADREKYLQGYAHGFMEGASGMLGAARGKDPAYAQGQTDGFKAYQNVWTARLFAEAHRHTGFLLGPDSHLIDGASPPDERRVRDSFVDFAARFDRAFAALLPTTLDMTIQEKPAVYSYVYQDYSRSNVHPESRRCLKGMIGIRVSVRDTKTDAADEWDGFYVVAFDYTPDGWKLDIEGVAKMPSWGLAEQRHARRFIRRVMVSTELDAKTHNDPISTKYPPQRGR